jgi:hypothetical protein
MVYAVVLAALLGTIYLWKGTAKRTLNDITNIAGALFICSTFLGAAVLRRVSAAVRARRSSSMRDVCSCCG